MSDPLQRNASTTTPLVKDPVCGMDVDPATSPYSSERDGQTYHFCSERCQAKFETSPIQNRRVMSSSSALGLVSALTMTSSSAMPQIGQDPGPGLRISGCIGQVHCVAGDSDDGGVAGDGSASKRARQPALQK